MPPRGSSALRLAGLASTAIALLLLAGATVRPWACGRPLVVAADTESAAHMTTIRVASSWPARVAVTPIGLHSMVRVADRLAYFVSPADGTVRVVDPRSGRVLRRFQLGAQSLPQDVAVVGRSVYVTRQGATRLLRIDLASGRTEELVDLAQFADSDGNPDMAMMAVDEGRLFVQLQRLDTVTGDQGSPGMLAVVDLASETLIDADPARGGVQAIELEGTFPKFKMQVLEESRRLYVSASGGFFDRGGIEIVDLDALRSLGLVIREEDGEVGADLGAFVMITEELGYLVYSTDLLLSSHLKRFHVVGGVGIVEPGLELHVTLDYFVPNLEHDPLTNQLFVPDGGLQRDGVFVFDAATGEKLTPEAIGTGGSPSDVALAPRW